MPLHYTTIHLLLKRTSFSFLLPCFPDVSFKPNDHPNHSFKERTAHSPLLVLSFDPFLSIRRKNQTWLFFSMSDFKQTLIVPLNPPRKGQQSQPSIPCPFPGTNTITAALFSSPLGFGSTALTLLFKFCCS